MPRKICSAAQNDLRAGGLQRAAHDPRDRPSNDGYHAEVRQHGGEGRHEYDYGQHLESEARAPMFASIGSVPNTTDAPATVASAERRPRTLRPETPPRAGSFEDKNGDDELQAKAATTRHEIALRFFGQRPQSRPSRIGQTRLSAVASRLTPAFMERLRHMIPACICAGKAPKGAGPFGGAAAGRRATLAVRTPEATGGGAPTGEFRRTRAKTDRG